MIKFILAIFLPFFVFAQSTDLGSQPGSGGGSGNATSIQSIPVCATAPTLNQLLQFNGTNYCPSTISGAGTVTSVGFMDGSSTPLFVISSSPITGAGTIVETLQNQSANQVFAGPTSGGAAQPTFRALVGADLPNPTTSTLGGVEAVTAPLHQFLVSISNFGVVGSAQPNFSDISGTLAGSQLPTFTGDVTNSNAAMTIAASAVTLAKMANLPAHTRIGNNTGSSAVPLALTSTQETADLNLFTTTLQGLVPGSGGGTTNFLRADGTWSTPSGSGSVSSVAQTVPTFLTISGSPITTSGTLAIGLASQSANNVFIGPSSGGAAAPTFRVLVPADVPVLNQNTTGSAGSISGTNVITNSNLVQIPAHSYLGNNTGSTANAAYISDTDVTLDLTLFTSTLQGVVPASGGGTTNFLRADGAWATTPGGGTVTSVAQTVPSILTISGSPIISTGTLAIGLATESANTVFAGPTAGGAATPTFRSIVAADVPTLNQNTTGTASNVTGIVAVANGGTNLSATTVNQILYSSATNTIAGLATANNGTLITSGAGVPSISTTLPSSVQSNITGTGTLTTGTWNGIATSGFLFITSGTTYTTPANITTRTVFKFTLIGGGGGGGGINTTNAKGAGGGSAGVGVIFKTGLTASTAYTIAIGAAGAGGTGTPTVGGNGGDTTLTIGATTYTAGGGVGGPDTVSNGVGGTGGTCTGFTINIPGQNGQGNGTASAVSSGSAGGNSGMGFGLGGVGYVAFVGLDGYSGTGFGSGGAGGAGLAGIGGGGAPGAILVEWNN